MVLLIAAFGVCFCSLGGQFAWRQQEKLLSYQPVEARISSMRMEVVPSSSDGDPSPSFEPVIVYRYEVNGTQYVSSQVTALRESSGRGWAQAILDLYRGKETATAYFDPRSPAEAFLFKRPSFAPYLFLLCGTLLLSLAFWIGWREGLFTGRRLPLSPRPYRASATAMRGLGLLVTSALWHLGGWLSWGHFTSLGDVPPGGVPFWSMLVYEALGLGPLGHALYYLWVSRSAPVEPRRAA